MLYHGLRVPCVTKCVKRWHRIIARVWALAGEAATIPAGGHQLVVVHAQLCSRVSPKDVCSVAVAGTTPTAITRTLDLTPL